jgi:hypothetical protein
MVCTTVQPLAIDSGRLANQAPTADGTHPMLEWIWPTRGRPTARKRPERDADVAASEPPGLSRRSAPLFKYLDDRYAEAVVLTFGEIEDLLGFALPALARLSDAWWTAPEPDAVQFADSWIQAGRTARPNLQARTVAFDRAL